MNRPVEVLVVGAGNSACVAALAAAEAGAVVEMLEAAPEAASGGNSRFTLGGFRFGYGRPEDIDQLIPGMTPDERALIRRRAYTPDDYVDTLTTLSRGAADPRLCRLLANHSLPTLRWMTAQWVEWDLRISGIAPEPMWAASPGNVYAVGRGPGLIAALRRAVESAGVSTRYGHRLEAVVLDGGGQVRAVVAARGDERVEIACRSLVVACGGFEANRDMRRRHLGEAWAGMKVRGTRYNRGLGIAALLAVGGQPAGQWDNGHAVPVAADAPEYGTFELGETTRRCLFQYGISVNQAGHRFMDEGADLKTLMYSTTGIAVAAQPGGVAFQVFDSRLNAANFEKQFYMSGSYHVADTLPGLAALIGVPTATPVAEVERYNVAVADDDRFDPTTLDGSAASGLTPPRSNFAARLVRPPFYAFPVAGGVTFTYGGVRIDDRCRVLAAGDRPIPGVFAAGELTGGFFAHTYPANAGLMRGAVTGRLAGAAAAAHAAGAEGSP